MVLYDPNGTGPLRSAFPFNAKRKTNLKMNPHTEAAQVATQNAEKESFWQWITCTKCKKIRLVNVDEELDTSSWCCEKNTQNPKYASCSSPQEKGDFRKVEKRQVSIIESDAFEDIQEATNHPNDLEIERKERAQRKMAWVKVQVDGNYVWWPGLTLKVVPTPLQKIIDEANDIRRAVRLFHPPKDLEHYQVVRRSSLKPFFLRALRRNSSSHPEFQVAVTEADQYFTEPDMDELSEIRKSETRLIADGDIDKCLSNYVPQCENAESGNELEVEGPAGDETRLNTTVGDFGKCVLNFVPHERAESNELDDAQYYSQVSEADEEIEFVEDGEDDPHFI